MSQLGVSHRLPDAQGLLAVQGVTTEGNAEQWQGKKGGSAVQRSTGHRYD